MVSLLRFPDIKPAVSIHDDVFVKIRNGPDFIVPDIEVKLLHRSFVQGSHHLQPGGFTDSPVSPYLNSKIQPGPSLCFMPEGPPAPGFRCRALLFSKGEWGNNLRVPGVVSRFSWQFSS